MTRASCRCGQALSLPPGSGDRVVCPKCGARVRIRRQESQRAAPSGQGDGYVRFFCPCGRRLKVSAERPPSHGKCPDCGRIVPVPAINVLVPAGPDARTADLSPADVAALEKWSEGHRARKPAAAAPQSTTDDIPVQTVAPGRVELGLRLCPSCGKPVHLGSDNCRNCGAAVPRR
jgi:hypothetical protein